MELLMFASHTASANLQQFHTWVGLVDIHDTLVEPEGASTDSRLTIQFAHDFRRSRSRWEVSFSKFTRTDAGGSRELPQPSTRCLLVDDRLYRYERRSSGESAPVTVVTPNRRQAGRFVHEIGAVLSPFSIRQQPVHAWLANVDRHRLAWDQGRRGAIRREGDLLILDYGYENRPEHYTFDLAKGGALVRERIDKGEYQTSAAVEMVQVGGIWVPSRVEYTLDMVGPTVRKLRRVMTWTRSEVNVKLSESEFTLAALGVPAGHTVYDTRSDAISTYPGEPAPLPPRDLARDAPVTRRSWPRHAAWAVPAAAAVVLATWLAVRKRRAARARPAQPPS